MRMCKGVVVALAIVLSSSDAFQLSSNKKNAFNPSRWGSRSSSTLSMSSALIVQNKGGGHGELGFQLAKNLIASQPKITSVTILQDDACNDSKEPFRSYSTDLSDIKIIKTPLSDETLTSESLQTILGENESYDYVWDNASKGPVGSGKAICDSAKSWNCKLFTYVSSAGMYQPTDETVFPMSEETPVKSSAGQAQMDAYAVELGLPLVSFRPQYIYGPKANKYDYIDWFLDRVVRGLPLLIPGDGTQLVSLTNSVDVAGILASVLNDEESAVSGRFFNCGSDKLVSYDDVAYLCADVVGVDRKSVNIVHYDAGELGKGKFPFRPSNFYVAPNKVKENLKWKGAQSTLEEDLGWYYEGYKSSRGKKVDLGKDWEIIKGLGLEGEYKALFQENDAEIS